MLCASLQLDIHDAEQGLEKISLSSESDGYHDLIAAKLIASASVSLLKLDLLSSQQQFTQALDVSRSTFTSGKDGEPVHLRRPRFALRVAAVL